MQRHVSMSRESLLGYMAECRTLVLDEMKRFVPDDPRFGPILYDLMLDYPLRSAKALRPAICIATCRALGGRLEAVVTSAMAVEMYHNAFLIHDDVEDGSERRRDGPTLHVDHGVPVAVNVGDAMLALALSPLLENVRLLSLGRALRILQEIARMARESAEGQATELSWIRDGNFALDDARYLRMVHKKTGVYSFVTPMVIGAIVADESDERIGQLRRFATAIGTAFQIQDDVLNLEADERRYGKEIAGDLWEGKHTLILMHAIRTAAHTDREHALGILRKPRPSIGSDTMSTFPALLDRLRADGHLTEEGHERLSRATSGGRREQKTAADVAFLDDLVHRQGSLAYAKRVARRRALRARHTLERIGTWLPPSIHHDFLHALTDFVVERDH